MEAEIQKMSHEHPRYGYRRITVMLEREGVKVGRDRVQRTRRRHGLQVKKRQRKLRRVGVTTGQRQRAEYPGHVWSWDFIHDGMETGSMYKMLTIVDEFSRQCLKIWPSWSIRAVDVLHQLEEAMKQYGSPGYLRSDNGPEFIAYAVQDWLKKKEIKTLYIQPGSPWENAYIESFHDKFRDELLNRELFTSLLEARVITEDWRCKYNNQRPHSSLDYQTPNTFAANFPTPSGVGNLNKINPGLTLHGVH
jgi:transposase InsO family protein